MSTAESITAVRSDSGVDRWQVAAPVSLLAELTHRCPLQCPYCSNPLELEKAGAELDTATWQRVLEEAAELGVLQVAFSGGEPTLRRDLADVDRPCRRARPVLQPDHRGRPPRRGAPPGAGRRRARSPAALGPGRRARQRRSHRRLSRRPCQEAADRRAGAPGGHSAHHQRRGPPAERRQSPGDHRAGDRVRRQAARGGARAVLRLGAGQPRGADADPRADGALGGAGRGRQGAPQGRARLRLRDPGLLRPLPQAVHGRLGEAEPECHALGQGPAVPRGGDHHHARVRQRQGALAQGDLVRGQRRSTRFAALRGWPSRAAAARARPWISAAAAARRSR